MIGVFDSGVGGLSVLAAIRRRMPQSDLVYFGDTENAPYGNKSARELAQLVSMALSRLAAAGATDIVAACNSVSVSVHAAPIDLLRIRKFNVIEMVGPTVDALAPLFKKIALLGTSATVRSGIYQDAFRVKGAHVEAIAVPELAGLIEEGAAQSAILPSVQNAVEQALHGGAEVISLSCTHYPFVRELFEQCLREAKSAVALFDPAEAVAEEVAARFSKEGQGALRFLVSKETPVFASAAAALFPDERYSIELAGSIYWALKAV